MMPRMFKALSRWLLVAGLVFLATPGRAAIVFRAAASASLASAVGNTPTLISSVSASTGASGAASLTINRPANVTSGTVLVAQLALKGGVSASGAVTAPSGWTLVDSTSSGGTSPLTQAVYWKVAGASEPASYTWSWTNAVRGTGGMAAFGNVDTLNPIDSWGVQSATAANSFTLPTITLNSTNVMLVAALASSYTNSHGTPTGMNELYDLTTGAGPNGITSSYATAAQVTTPTSGARSATSVQTADNIAHVLALRAAGAALTISVPTGTTVGDVMIAGVIARPCSSTNNGACTTSVTAPAAWTLVRQIQTGNGGGTDGYGDQIWVYRRVVTGAEPASYTWFFGGRPQQAGAGGGILTFSGVDNSSPIVAEAGQATASGTSHTTPSINTGAVANTMLVTTIGSSSAASWTAPTGMTERVDVASRAVPNDLGVSLEMANQIQAAAGAVAAKTASYTGTSPAGDTGGAHLLALRPAPVGPDHYELSLASSSVSCVASTVTVRACANNSSPCTSTYAGASGYTATLGTSGATLGATTVTFDASGVASTTLQYPGAADGTNVAVTLSGESLSAVNLRQCCTDGTTCAVSNSCSTQFKTAGFIFSNAANGSSATIGPQVAGTSSATYYLRAVRTNTATMACEAALVGTNNVNMAYECANPATCSGSNLMSLNGGTATTIARNDSGSVSAYTAVAMTFDANGNAPLTLNYSDVGQVKLYANRAAGATAAGSLLAPLAGVSNPFVVAPDHFGFSNVTSGPIKAGTNFAATVTAYGSTNSVTPNFGRESAPEGVTLSFTRYQPSGTGAVNGSFTGSLGLFSGGQATGVDLNWSEVGLIDLTATLVSGSYLGSGLTASGSTGTTGAVGRFIPHHFDVTVVNACSGGGFTYSGQPLKVTVQAKNGLATSTVTQNYDGGGNTSPNFAKAVDLSEVLAGAAGALSANSVPMSAFVAGIASAAPVYTFTVNPTVLTIVQLRATEAAPAGDGVTSQGFAEGTAAIRSGRLRLANAYGSELLSLPVPLEAQYWSAAGYYVRNTDDSCTAIPMSSIIMGNYVGTLSACETQLTPVAVQTLAAGRLPGNGLVLTAPGAGNSGSVDLTLNTGSVAAGSTCLSTVQTGATASGLPWLGPNPSGRATFGIYKSRLIYSRENY